MLGERRGKNGDFMGRSERNEIVHFAFAGDATGQMVPVRISEAYNNSLRGVVEAGFALAPRKNAALAPLTPSSPDAASVAGGCGGRSG